MLRDYQKWAIADLYNWMTENEGNPCLVLPTGAGKSHIIAALCKDALQNWPETRILMVTHQKELIEQNAAKLRLHWPMAPLGIYSASIGQRVLGESITFAGIQSLIRRIDELGHVDLVFIDECFVSGTKVSTPSGEKDIDKVSCGDVVLTQAGHGTVQAVSRRMVNETYVVETSDGRRLECTGNHPFFTEQGWRPASSLVDGTSLFRIQDMLALWQLIPPMGEEAGEWNHGGASGECLEKAKLLLSEVCKEIEPDCSNGRSSQQNQKETERNEASTDKARRERAIASLAAACASSCSWRGLGGRGDHPDESWQEQRDVSDGIQDRHCEQKFDDSHRDRRREPFLPGEEITRQEEGSVFGGTRVVSVSRVKRESPVAVFNLHVSGHPSFFANGVAVHNCHLVNHADEGSYRVLVSTLKETNPNLRVVGLTATPYRLGHGYITEKPAIFDGLVEPVSIEELVYKGFLAPLRSKLTKTRLDTSGVHKRGGEFIERELQRAVDRADVNGPIVREVIELAGDRQSWLFFCAGVEHAAHIRDELQAQGIDAECVTGATPKTEREDILRRFREGSLRAVTNANVLTTGFDHPGIDVIAMLRPTMSTALYVQMAGRGMRPAPDKTDCLVLDFAGNVSTHGPITAVNPQRVRGDGEGEAMIPCKACEQCFELCPVACRTCPACGAAFPEPERGRNLELHDDDIMGTEEHLLQMPVAEWQWRKHVSKASGKEMLSVSYYKSIFENSCVTEYFPVMHEGFAQARAVQQVADIAFRSSAPREVLNLVDLEAAARMMNAGKPPARIKYKRDGKFFRIMKREWA